MAPAKGAAVSLRRLAALIAVAVLLVGAGAAAAQTEKAGKEKKAEKADKGEGKGKAKKPSGPPKLDAKAWILVDALDGEVLAEQASDNQRPIASTTKLMTAYLALRRLKAKQSIKAVPYSAAAAESIVGFPAGEKLTVKDLLYALLLPSANDAAATLAVGVSGSEKKFVAEMNNAAKTLGLDNTSYANPIGLDESGNYSSAADLVALSDQLLANDLFARIVDTPKATLRSVTGKPTITTRNTLLLEDPNVIGVKTGHTIEAGYVLVAAAKRNGTTLISAVLGARNEATRDAETLELLDYGFSQYKAQVPVKKGETFATPDLDYRDETIPLVAKREVPVSIRNGQRVRTRVSAPDEVEGPIEEGETLGRVAVSVDGRVAGASPLVAADAAEAATFVQKAVETVGKPLYLIPAGVLVIVVGLLLALRGRGKDEEEDVEEEDDPEPQEPQATSAPAPKPAPQPKAEAAAAPQPPPRKPPPAPQPQQEAEEPPEPKRRRLRRERKPKGPRERTPEERRQMAMERAKRRKGRGQ